MDHVWSVLCLKASIDRETNNISLFDVVEQIQVLPQRESGGVVGPFELVSLWTRSVGVPERGEVRVSIRGPSEHLYAQEMQEIDLREFRRMRARFRVAGIAIEGPGTYHFSVEVRPANSESWTEVAKIPLEVEEMRSTPQRARF